MGQESDRKAHESSRSPSLKSKPCPSPPLTPYPFAAPSSAQTRNWQRRHHLPSPSLPPDVQSVPPPPPPAPTSSAATAPSPCLPHVACRPQSLPNPPNVPSSPQPLDIPASSEIACKSHTPSHVPPWVDLNVAATKGGMLGCQHAGTV